MVKCETLHVSWQLPHFQAVLYGRVHIRITNLDTKHNRIHEKKSRYTYTCIYLRERTVTNSTFVQVSLPKMSKSIVMFLYLFVYCVQILNYNDDSTIENPADVKDANKQEVCHT